MQQHDLTTSMMFERIFYAISFEQSFSDSIAAIIDNGLQYHHGKFPG